MSWEERKRVKDTKKTGRHPTRGFGGRNLDLRQKKLVRMYLDPESPTYMNKTQSGLAAGYVGKMPAAALNPLRMAKGVKRAIEQAMESAGINDDLLAQRHHDLLMKQEIRFNPRTLKYETTDQPDTPAVKAALELAYRVKGDFAPEKSISMTMDLNQILEQIQSNEQPLVRDPGQAPRPELETEQSLLDRQ